MLRPFWARRVNVLRRHREIRFALEAQLLEDRVMLSTVGLTYEIPEISAGAAALQEAHIASNAFTAEPTEPNSPSVVRSVEGINFEENASNDGFFHIPPDPIGAVGLDHLVSVVNTSIEWHTKSGTQQNSQSLASFFAPLSPANSTFDPKVIYDQAADRFVVVTLEFVGRDTGTAADDASRILIAVSDDGDPNGTWHYQAINALTVIGGVNTWADYPGIATDGQAIYITNNMFEHEGGANAGVRLWIVGKGEGTGGLYDGSTSPVTIHDPYAGGGIATTTQPAQIFGTAPGSTGTFLVSYSGISGGGTEFFQVVRVDNPLTSPSFSQQYINAGDIENSTGGFPDAPQSGTATLVETNDRRAINAVWRDDSLYFAATIVPNSGVDAGQATAHWAQLNTTTLASITIADQGNIGGEDVASGTYTFFPSIAVNSAGDIAVGFAASAPSIFPGAYYALRRSTDPAGTFQPVVAAAAGVDYYVRTFGGSRNRWGDYTGTVLDPENDSFWVFNEYALARGTMLGGPGGSELGRWGTRWVNFDVAAPVLLAALINNGSANRSGIAEIALTFSQDVTISAASNLNLFNHTVPSAISLAGATLEDNGTTVVTLNLSSVTLPDGYYSLEVPASEAVNSSLLPLTTTTTFTFFVLSGDANGTGNVNASDFSDVTTNFSTPQGDPYRTGDTTGDGFVNASDFSPITTNFSNSLLSTPLTFDFGDAAPDSATFPTTLTNDGARHVITGTSLRLGALRDNEGDGQSGGAPATGDDITGSDDEDGVTIAGGALETETPVNISIVVAGTGYLNVWIDFNNDGDWDDAGEQVAHDLSASNETVVLPVTAPQSTQGTAIARFRLTASTGYSYSGLAPNGEVEDYAITINNDSGPAAPLSLAVNDTEVPGPSTSSGWAKSAGWKNMLAFTPATTQNTDHNLLFKTKSNKPRRWW